MPDRSQRNENNDTTGIQKKKGRTERALKKRGTEQALKKKVGLSAYRRKRMQSNARRTSGVVELIEHSILPQECKFHGSRAIGTVERKRL